MEITDLSAVRVREALLGRSHIASLSDYARSLREATGEAVPWFDPLDGGAEARLLVLMEAPSRRGIQIGFVSVDNPTPTGRRMRETMERAGLRREERVVWNVVPWYLGGAAKARNPTLAERRAGALHLAGLLALLPSLRAVLTLGGPAREGWRSLGSDLPHVAAPHPSNTNLCARPWLREEFERAVAEATALVTG